MIDWITDRMPDTEAQVLVYYEYYDWSKDLNVRSYALSHYCIKINKWSGEVGSFDNKVIAWMPIPVFKGESNDRGKEKRIL